MCCLFITSSSPLRPTSPSLNVFESPVPECPRPTSRRPRVPRPKSHVPVPLLVTASIIDTADKEILGDLSPAFDDVFCAMQQCLANVSLSPTTAAQNICPKLTSVEPGRPAFDISAELLEDLLGLGFSHTKIAEMLGVSRWIISRRVKPYDLDDITTFSKLTEDRWA